MTPDKKETILIVDSTPAERNELSDYLQEHGFNVLSTGNGKSALRCARQDEPDLILLDVVLPDMDGFETCRRLKRGERTQNIPVIFLTESDETQDKLKAFELGAADYITKPIQPELALARIKTHLQVYRLQKDLREQNKCLTEENIRRRRVQDALRESRERYRLLADNSTDMISQQSPNGIYRYVSPACQHLLGYKIEEMVGRSIYDFFHPEDLKAIEELNELVAQWPTVSTITYRARRKDNSYIWLETVNRIVYDPETNQPDEVIAVSRDVTERKQLLETLQIQNKELDAFAHTVAHDLKNPLGAIVGYGQLLTMGLNKMDLEQVLGILQQLTKTGEQMVNIVESLLLLAGVRKGEAEMVPLNMADIIEQTELRLKFMIEEHEAKIIQPETWPSAIGYAPWVEEIWANYLSNGLKYGGRPPHLEFGYDDYRNGMIRFWIKDNGAGLTPEDQANLFTEFTRLSELEIEGHGLGLSIVRRIIEKLSGQVGVESKVGRGSTFYFTLPSADNQGH